MASALLSWFLNASSSEVAGMEMRVASTWIQSSILAANLSFLNLIKRPGFCMHLLCFLCAAAVARSDASGFQEKPLRNQWTHSRAKVILAAVSEETPTDSV